MLQKKKDFIERIMLENGYKGPISGFPECKKCKGICCLTNSCSAVPDDFEELTVQGIEKIVDSGKFMIAASFKKAEGSGIPIVALPLISAREINVPENGIHISMIRSRCALIGENGCILSEDERPSQGLMLIPTGDDKCKCFVDTPQKLWMPYKDILDEVVQKRTGKTSQELFEEELPQLALGIKKKIERTVKFGRAVTSAEYYIARAMRDLGVFYKEIDEEVLDKFFKEAPII